MKVIFCEGTDDEIFLKRFANFLNIPLSNFYIKPLSGSVGEEVPLRILKDKLREGHIHKMEKIIFFLDNDHNYFTEYKSKSVFNLIRSEFSIPVIFIKICPSRDIFYFYNEQITSLLYGKKAWQDVKNLISKKKAKEIRNILKAKYKAKIQNILNPQSKRSKFRTFYSKIEKHFTPIAEVMKCKKIELNLQIKVGFAQIEIISY